MLCELVANVDQIGQEGDRVVVGGKERGWIPYSIPIMGMGQDSLPNLLITTIYGVVNMSLVYCK
jgi:hypothetical protein